MFGKQPNQAISRSAQKNEIIDMFSLEPMTEQIAVITGVRGSGKTVLMTSIMKELETDPNWSHLELN